MATQSSSIDLRLVGVVLAVLLVLAYSTLIAQQLLFGVGVLVWGFFIYLAWRFIVAIERIADAQERRAAAAERRVD